MEFYLALKKNDSQWFEGKWMQLEDIMLSEVSQVQKHKGKGGERGEVAQTMYTHVSKCKNHKIKGERKDKVLLFPSIWGRQIQKINIYTKNKHHIQLYIWNMFVIVELHYGTQGKKERKRMSTI
jgi:hypothetical protein